MCYACFARQRTRDGMLCLSCLIDLPESDMYLYQENYFTEKLRGIQKFETGAGLFLFEQGSPIQGLVHRIKYKNRPDIAVKFGVYMGEKLKTAPLYKEVDLIVPVPLHKSRYNKRGFNQSEKFAQGLAVSMQIPMDSANIIRTRYTETQTKKGKKERVKNVDGAFQLKNEETYRGKNILLVDDVITTGATLGACMDVIDCEGIYLITLGVAIN